MRPRLGGSTGGVASAGREGSGGRGGLRAGSSAQEGRDGRRRAARRPLATDARLYLRGGLVAIVRTRDIGKGGIFLEVSDPSFNPGTYLHVELRDSRGRWDGALRPGLVAHRGSRGIGVTFLH